MSKTHREKVVDEYKAAYKAVHGVEPEVEHTGGGWHEVNHGPNRFRTLKLANMAYGLREQKRQRELPEFEVSVEIQAKKHFTEKVRAKNRDEAIKHIKTDLDGESTFDFDKGEVTITQIQCNSKPVGETS